MAFFYCSDLKKIFGLSNCHVLLQYHDGIYFNFQPLGIEDSTTLLGFRNSPTVHCKMKRVDLAQMLSFLGPKQASPVWHWLGVNSAPLKWGCFWHLF